MIDCDEMVKRLYFYLDRELTPEEQGQIQQHLADCPSCRERFRFEENVLHLVRRCCRDVAAPPALVERVRRLCDQ